MQVTYHAANLPIYRNIYHEMKINLPLYCCCCCFLTYIYAHFCVVNNTAN